MNRTTAARTAAPLLLLLPFLFSCCGKQADPQPETVPADAPAAVAAAVAADIGDDAALPETHVCTGFDDRTDAALAALSGTYRPVAVQLALLEGNTIKTFCYGYADRGTGRAVTEDTKYRVASLSKLAAAVVFMAAKDRGVADDTADISGYFGETCRNPAFPETVITPAMLMTHTASLDTEGVYEYTPGLLSGHGVYLYTEPGTAYYYSNIGYGVLSCALERASGRDFSETAREWVFTPMGIDASFRYDGLTDASDVGALYGENGGLSVAELREMTGRGAGRDLTLACGDLIISAKDYVKLLGILLHGGIDVGGTRILSGESVDAMLMERFRTETFGVAYGSQIQTNVIDGETVYVHTGSAYGMFSAYVFDPETKRAAVVLTVGEERWADPESEVYYLCQELIRAVW